ncbi:hypothetical protein G6F70_001150 [Rhizopus microsporus]|uniref:CCHC-type domain-containing protein n=2 Tax=Rhizopus TaxID=4842 RepID=A0A367JLQ6_RHIAZ|nr:hypothetical protein G6F71_000991 [Rhizopus microsporus]RCH90872.1 hypothetical protein CU097_011149 [Rhizopus azygosporus]KAG1203699.1 hypothetical protein G6F70_001150 [Rhizopus microsporus]KAG1215312.1 hypothetical protein G6F69_001131 [Rhizopus microsporus]KAG1237864.1 hypothetical protein G6F67_000875 [Rhizopus microsporus]
MYDDDEEELELLRQYEEENIVGDGRDTYSSEELDSDLEEKILSVTHYDVGVDKKKKKTESAAPERSTPTAPVSAPDARGRVLPSKSARRTVSTVHAPIDFDRKRADFSAASELKLNSSDEEGEYRSEEEKEEEMADVVASDSSSEEEELREAPPPVTRHINLDDKQYMDDVETSEEERELGAELRVLIEDSIQARGGQSRLGRPSNARVIICYRCKQPGHQQQYCLMCTECGLKHRGPCMWPRYCRLCKMDDHNKEDCRGKRETRDCELCGDKYHNTEICTKMLHIYDGEKPASKSMTIFCYNCGDYDHFGDQCRRYSYNSIIPSVFSEESINYSELNKNRKKSNKRKRREHYYFESDDDDISRKKSKSSRDYRHPSSNNNNNNNNNSSSSHRMYNKGSPSSSSTTSSVYSRDEGKKRKKGKKVLDDFFGKQKGNRSPGSNQAITGNSNWKAINNYMNSLPQPSRSGTVQLNKNKNNRERADLPKPSKSGVIDF